MEKTKLILASICLVLCFTTVLAFTTRAVFLFPRHYTVVEQYIHKVGSFESRQLKLEIHSTVKQYRWIDGSQFLIYSYSHPAAMTTKGENLTAAKISGAIFNVTDYNENVTYISLGHRVGLTTGSTQLPGEWNRSSSLTPEYLAVGNWNYSYSFYPGGAGTTNATGLNWLSTGNHNLWAYDTFATITYGAGDQIDVEWSIDVQYS